VTPQAMDPCAPVPVRLEPVAEPAGDGALSEGPADLAGASGPGRRRHPAPIRVSDRNVSCCWDVAGQPRSALPGHGGRAALFRVTRNANTDARGGRDDLVDLTRASYATGSSRPSSARDGRASPMHRGMLVRAGLRRRATSSRCRGGSAWRA
jgi:hypothetical protein